MTVRVIAFTQRGGALGRMLADGLEGTLTVPARFAHSLDAEPYESLEQWTAQGWASGNAFLFVGAAGIAVRAIAPHVRDKFTDPAVVSVDEAGDIAVPLLSGHVGGGNDLARRVAALTGGRAAVSTATDVNGVFAVDVWARDHGLALTDRVLAKEISAALLEGQRVGFASDFGDDCPPGLVSEVTELGVSVTCRTGPGPFGQTLRLVPRCLTLGIGCRRGTAAEAIDALVTEVLEGLDPASVGAVATIDLKQDEPGLLAVCRGHGWPLRVFSAEELNKAKGAFTPSEFVKGVTGVDNVCERAAVLASGGRLIAPKRAKNGVTAAVAERSAI